MKKVLYIILISIFSLTIISCSDEKEEYSATDDTTADNTTTDNTTTDNTTTDNTTTTDTTSPTVESISPTDNQGGVSISDNISVTFSVAMDNSSVTTNSSNTSCSGSLELSSDNFSNCIQMSSSPSSSNSEKTFTIDPSDNLSRGTTYKTRVTTGVKDSAGNTLGSQYETSSGFTTWSGTQQLGTSSGDTKTDGVTVDSSGNIYVTGYTSGGLDNNTNSGSNDIFLVKYNSSGVKQWTKQLGTSNSDVGRGVTVDSSDNIYVTGSTSGGLDDNTNTAGSSWDFFLVKYNSSGVKQWTEQYGSVVGGYTDFGQGVTVDSSDNLYVTGTTNGGIDNNTSSGSDDIFLIKYNSSGEKQWTQQLGTSSRDRVALDADEIMDGVTVDSSDNIYVVGQTQGGLDNNTNSGDWDFFLVKYNSSGTKQWTQQLGTSSKDVGNGVAVDSSDNIYVTGTTGGGLDNNTSFGSNDIFLVKYNSSGEKQWTQQLGGHWYTSSGNIVYSHNDAGTGVTVDSSNNIYVTGVTSRIIGGNTDYGGVDIFLVKYNSSGVIQWAKQLGSSGHDYGQGVTVDSFNNIYVTGKTDGGLDGNTNSGSLDVFLVKYNSDGVLQ
jgi:uncharacterized delta-60 repeat protein